MSYTDQWQLRQFTCRRPYALVINLDCDAVDSPQPHMIFIIVLGAVSSFPKCIYFSPKINKINLKRTFGAVVIVTHSLGLNTFPLYWCGRRLAKMGLFWSSAGCDVNSTSQLQSANLIPLCCGWHGTAGMFSRNASGLRNTPCYTGGRGERQILQNKCVWSCEITIYFQE